ncbi:hypothetical protein M9H77_18962 [Catharanthus roseus]|uniref:Uncharacterized protein n=1 Tax=Catharanthus roseus TaxID=4058 RepID=A0ACC0B8W9_CATRO|nr:hypothetical protein M9H77_18962 [Catharanthus roseus]
MRSQNKNEFSRTAFIVNRSWKVHYSVTHFARCRKSNQNAVESNKYRALKVLGTYDPVEIAVSAKPTSSNPATYQDGISHVVVLINYAYLDQELLISRFLAIFLPLREYLISLQSSYTHTPWSLPHLFHLKPKPTSSILLVPVKQVCYKEKATKESNLGIYRSNKRKDNLIAKQYQMLESSHLEINNGGCLFANEAIKTINIERLVPSPLTLERKTGGTHISLLYSGLLH